MVTTPIVSTWRDGLDIDKYEAVEKVAEYLARHHTGQFITDEEFRKVKARFMEMVFAVSKAGLCFAVRTVPQRDVLIMMGRSTVAHISYDEYRVLLEIARWSKSIWINNGWGDLEVPRKKLDELTNELAMIQGRANP